MCVNLLSKRPAKTVAELDWAELGLSGGGGSRLRQELGTHSHSLTWWKGPTHIRPRLQWPRVCISGKLQSGSGAWESNPDTLMWDAGVTTAGPNAHP